MEAVDLHPALEELIEKICRERCISPPDISARRLLFSIAETSAIEILKKISVSSGTIRNFNGYIIHMVNNSDAAAVKNNNGVLSHKRSGLPLSAPSQKYTRHVSLNSQQLVRSPLSPTKYKTVPESHPPQKQVSFVNSPNTINDVSWGPKRLTFSSVCDTDDAHNTSNIGQQPIVPQNVSYRVPNLAQNTLSPCSTSKRTGPTYVPEVPFSIQNGSQVPKQQTLLSGPSFGGATLGNVGNAIRVNPVTRNQSEIARSLPISQQSLNLAELEFRKMFLLYSYVGRRKLEDVVSVQDAIDIKSMKTATMFDFEAKIWAKYGSANCVSSDRAMHLDWDSGKTYLYHCYVSIDGTYRFKGPFLNTRRTHLQRKLGDDNVLIVQFTDVFDPDMPFNKQNWSAAYQTISDGISIGVRHYSLFAFKDGRGDNKKPKEFDTKKSRSSWAVKCYFVRHKSHAHWDEKDSIFSDKTMHEVRCLFMHVHTVPSIAKYISRCSLALSNTIQLRVDLATVDVQRIEDIPCRDENGDVVCDKDGEPLIHTDGTGFISEDLAILCEKHFIEAKGSKDESYELEEESLGMEGISDPPLLVQCRIFKDGYAVKGTLLVNKKLQPRTIQVRPSMIKVERDPTLSGSTAFSSLEIVSVSRKPRKASLSKNLIALLTVGGVPAEYFMSLLHKTLQDAQKVSLSMRAALRFGLNYGQMDDNATSVAMIGSGIPLDEPYLQHRMSFFANEERKALRGGKIPTDDSFYLIGTVDPTGTLESDEVCVILENGQVSGKVLVYRNPGVHFGDIHILKAKYVPALEEFVGNAKYGIFFSTKGRRSVGSEIANGDFDGDLYWVSQSAGLLHHFKASKPWEKTYFIQSAPSKKPSELSHDELEKELVTQLFTTQKQNMVAGKSADSLLTFEDQYIVLGNDDAEKHDVEKHRLEEKMLKLTDLYYDALDAGKSGKKIEISTCLLPKQYPHFLEKNADKSYHSSSVLGLIYDTVKGYQPDNASRKEVWKLPCFDVKVPEATINLWKDRYKSYRWEMSDALKSGDESKNNSADIVIKKYKKMLYEAEDFAKSTRKTDDIYNEAIAIYHASYDTAMSYTIADVRKCGFAWKVAGEALCSFYQKKTPGRSIPFKASVLSKLF